MYIVLIAVIGNVLAFLDFFDHNFFCRLAKCHDQHRSEIFGEVQFFFDGIGI